MDLDGSISRATRRRSQSRVSGCGWDCPILLLLLPWVVQVHGRVVDAVECSGVNTALTSFTRTSSLQCQPSVI